jgi:hypothetical protein
MFEEILNVKRVFVFSLLNPLPVALPNFSARDNPYLARKT